MSIRFEIVRYDSQDRRYIYGGKEGSRDTWIRSELSQLRSNSGSGQWYSTRPNAKRAMKRLLERHPSYKRAPMFCSRIKGQEFV